ncbi:MAG TPA: GGDEF domain-containing protein [Terracidiphilus sp.]|nr:GGDEF domain-containing protein [Terracidiphilus sp.]
MFSRRALLLKCWLLSIAALLAAARCPMAIALDQRTSLASVRALTNAEAVKAYPVSFEATVTYYRDYDIDLFVQDGPAAIYVRFRPGANLMPGDRVVVTGKTQESFRPIVVAETVVVTRHGALPEPVKLNVDELFDASRDCELVTVRGIVRSAAMVWSARHRNLYMQVLTDGGYIDAAVNSDDSSALTNLLDAEVEITGVMASKFDEKMQESGAVVDVGSLAGIRILHSAGSNPGSLPITPIENVLRGHRVRDLTRRLQVEGTITYYQPGEAVVLQKGSKSIWVTTLSDAQLKIGDRAYASGFPGVRNGYLSLDYGEIRDSHLREPISPVPVDWKEMDSGNHAFDLVSAEGQLVMEAREAAQDEYVLNSNGHIFSAILRHPGGVRALELPPMKQVPIGSRVRVTGVNKFYSTDPFNGPVASDLLLRGFDDVMVIASPPLLNIRNLSMTVAMLLIVVLFFATRGWKLEHKVRQQTARFAAMSDVQAEIERRRSLILEEINGNGPLPEILEQIVGLVSFRLGGNPCWLESKDGACLVPRPRDLRGLRIEHREMHSGAGATLGSIAAGLTLRVPPRPDQLEALSMGSRLATLAIETRRLYADLVHRSEFDQLTGAHNRFSLEKHLDVLIQSATPENPRFGVVYLDLDGFKQVNDLFGHRIGDLYLEQVAARLQGRIRAHDILARIGGDEFAALVSDVNTGAEIDEVIHRLQSGLDQPILIEDHALHASASFGFAIFPEDGTTHDSLLAAADSAMYTAKNIKRSARAATLVR